MTEHTPWKIGTDLFAAKHVYDAGGDRLTNDHRSGSAEWDEICHLIAAAPSMLETLEWIAYEASQYADGAEDSHYLAREMANFEAKARSAIAKARGKAND